MKFALLSFGIAVFAGVALTWLVRGLARKLRMVDYALTSRKIHAGPVPRVGGVAIALAFAAAMACVFAVGLPLGGDGTLLAGLLAGGGAIIALGIYDDTRGANAKVKFLVQFCAAGVAYAAGFRIDSLALPFGPELSLGIFGLPFTMLWIAGIINALNLIDGLDGLAGGVAFIASGTTFAVAALHGDGLMVVSSAALAGAVLGFLVFNFNPASIFMGDTGSMFLGFVLATTAIETHAQSSEAVGLLVPIVALGFPIADTLLAMSRRAARGVPIFRGDREHIHHRLLDRGMSQRQVVLTLYATSAVLGSAAVFLAYATTSSRLWLLLALGAVSFVVLQRLGFVSIERAHHVAEQRRRNLSIHRELRRIGERIRTAPTPEELRIATSDAADLLGATCVALAAVREDVADLSFDAGFDEAPRELFRVRYGLDPERPGDDTIELGWADGRSSIDRDTEIAIEVLCVDLSAAVERLANDRGRSYLRVVSSR